MTSPRWPELFRRPAERAGGATASAASKTTPLPADVPPGIGRLRAKSAEQLTINPGAIHGAWSKLLTSGQVRRLTSRGASSRFCKGVLCPGRADLAIGAAALCALSVLRGFTSLCSIVAAALRDEALLGRVGLLAGQLGVTARSAFQSARLHGPIAYGLLSRR